MELRQTESLGILNHHYRGVRHIYSNLDDRCGDKDICPSCGKGVHIELLDFAGLLAMNNGDFIIRHRETPDNLLVTSLKVLIIKFLALKYERIDYKHLAACGNLFADEIVHLRALSLPYQHCLDRLAAWRHLIYNGHVQVAVEGHRKGSRNWGRGHNKDMRRRVRSAF